MNWDAAFEEQAAENRSVSIAAEVRLAARPKRKEVMAFNFNHGEFGWLADRTHGEIEWDGIGDDEPTDEEVEAAQAYWSDEGLRDRAEEMADHQYNLRKEDF